MTRNTVFLAAAMCAFHVSLTGCSRRNPVDEVSLNQSKVAVVDRAAQDQIAWPGWRGPDRNGIAVDQPLLTTWSESTNVLWRSDVPGRGHSSPIVVANSVYLATALEDQEKQQIVAFDRGSGAIKWTTSLHQGHFPSARAIHKKGTHANGTIACDGQRLFIAFLNADNVIASAVDFSGEILWQREIGKFVSKFGYAPSPVLYRSLVIFAADNSGGGYLAAVDGQTGELAWRIKRGRFSSYSSPTIATVGGRDQLLISGGDAVTSYDPATGEQNWSTACIAEATCGTIVTTPEWIFASGGYPGRETVCLNADGKQLWSNGTKVYEPSLLVAGDQLIAISDDGVAYGWQATTGDVLWRKRLGGDFSASPILCNNLIYVSNLSGETFVFSTAGGKYQPVAKNKLGSDCYASPAVAAGQLFLRIGLGAGRDRREQLVCLAEPRTAEAAD